MNIVEFDVGKSQLKMRLTSEIHKAQQHVPVTINNESTDNICVLVDSVNQTSGLVDGFG